MFLAAAIPDFLAKGGIAMWVLVLCSVVGAAVIVERLVYHARLRLDVREFLERLAQALATGDTEKAEAVAAGVRHPVARIAQVYLAGLRYPPALARDLLVREGNEALAALERRLRVLATVAQISPLLGLLGTVAGMVKAFATIESMEGMVQPAQLAGGIWEALLTTVAGLIVAIPCIAMLHYFQSRTAAINHDMEGVAIFLDEWFAARKSDG